MNKNVLIYETQSYCSRFMFPRTCTQLIGIVTASQKLREILIHTVKKSSLTMIYEKWYFTFSLPLHLH